VGTISKTTVINYLSEAWRECKDERGKRQLFFSLLVSLGDITNREHNIFKKKGLQNVDNGGSSLRKVFLYCMEWMHTNSTDTFYSLLPLLGEYYNLGANSMFHILWTDRYTGQIKEVFKINVDVERITDYIASVLRNPRTTENELKLWAKWLWHIPSSTRKRKFEVTTQGLKSVRQKHKQDANIGDVITRVGEKQAETKEKDAFALQCIRALSKKMEWEVIKHPTNIQYVGYSNFKKRFRSETEATLFSSKKITEFDKVRFINWLDQLPSGARFNVQRRLVEKTSAGGLIVRDGKWKNFEGTNLGVWYLEWLAAKQQAQSKVRTLTDDDREQMKRENPQELKQMLKDAKVNTGANQMIDVLVVLMQGGQSIQEFDAMAFSILEKIKLDVPLLVIADISGSMRGHSVMYNGMHFTPQRLCQLLVTMFLLKNPRPELREMFIRFDEIVDVVAEGQVMQVPGLNRLLTGRTETVNKLIDRSKPFSQNLATISKFVDARNQTYFGNVADKLNEWVLSDGGAYTSVRKELINQYPVFLVVSDGDMNRPTHINPDPRDVVQSFMDKMRTYFGWDGVLAIWDVQTASNEKSAFDGIGNVVHFNGFNPGILNQVFTNIHDLDVIDAYTVLDALSKSNRYSLVREAVQ
jgi:hypothetical protein